MALSEKRIREVLSWHFKHEGGPGYADAAARSLRGALLLADNGDHAAVDHALDLANTLLHADGVEAINGKHVDGYYQDIVALYVNMGDPYIPTLLYNTVTESFYLGGWGNWVESHERAYRIR